MKAIERRLDRLEDRLAPRGKSQMLLVVTDAAQKLALDSDRCVQILREAGRIDSASPISVVDLGCIPNGLDAAELERYLSRVRRRPQVRLKCPTNCGRY